MRVCSLILPRCSNALGMRSLVELEKQLSCIGNVRERGCEMHGYNKWSANDLYTLSAWMEHL